MIYTYNSQKTVDNQNPYSILRSIFLFAFASIILTGCVSTIDLSEKYSSVIGKQYRTKTDSALCKQSWANYDFTPYQLDDTSGTTKDCVDLIPAGTIVTIRAAKRSYKGGDWDYIIAELTAPSSGKVYQFEELLGFSNFSPFEIGKRWEPVDKSANVDLTYLKEKYYNDTNGKFSIRGSVFTTQLESWSAANPAESSSLSYTFDTGEIIRIDSWTVVQHPLARWTKNSQESDTNDRTLEGMLKFTRAKTKGLENLSVLTKRTSAEMGGAMSGVVIRMQIDGGDYPGTSFRGFLAFMHGTDTYIIHYQTGQPSPSDDKVAAELIMKKLIAIKDAMIFHS